MKKKLLMFTAFLGLAIVSAEPTPAELAAEYTANWRSSGLDGGVYFEANREALLPVAQAIAESDQELGKAEKVLLTHAAMFGGLSPETAEAYFRKAGTFTNTAFIQNYATKQDIIDHVFGKPYLGGSVQQAATRLGESTLLEDYNASLIGAGLYPVAEPANARERGVANWARWFDKLVAESEPAAAVSLLDTEIMGLLAPDNKKEDDPAWAARLSSLRGTRAVIAELID